MASTHDLQKTEAIGCNLLSELDPKLIEGNDVIGIDEGQFFLDVVSFSDYWANKGKVIIVAGLDATFERKPFNKILELIPLSEDICKLNAVCMMCHREASFTKRIGSEKDVELIGGADKYLSTCRRCFSADSVLTLAQRQEMAASNPSTPKIEATVSTPLTLTLLDSDSPLSPLSPPITESTEKPSTMLPVRSLSLTSNKRVMNVTEVPINPMTKKIKLNNVINNEENKENIEIFVN
jgi:thymidine kinase